MKSHASALSTMVSLKFIKQTKIGILLVLKLTTGFNMLSAQGGYQISARFESAFRLQSTDVWNINMNYAGNNSINAYLEASIADMKGRKLIQLVSDPFLLQPGSNSLFSSTILTRTQRYFVQGLQDLEQVCGSLPSGSYNICYQAFCSSADCDGNGAGVLYNEFPQCVHIIVEPPTPLLLAWPENGAEIDIRRPVFNWIPPMPLAQVSGFTYNHTLYLAANGQTCNEAVLRNPPIHRNDGLDQPSMPYPPELDDLDTGKTYCWKVDGMLSGVQVAQSEVWRLKVRTEKVKRDTAKYIRMKKLLDGGFVTVRPDDRVYFMLEGSYRFDTMLLKISGDHGTELCARIMPLIQADTAAGEVKISEPLFTYGDHKYFLNLASIGLREGYYTFSTAGVNKLTHYSRIRITK